MLTWPTLLLATFSSYYFMEKDFNNLKTFFLIIKQAEHIRKIRYNNRLITHLNMATYLEGNRLYYSFEL